VKRELRIYLVAIGCRVSYLASVLLVLHKTTLVDVHDWLAGSWKLQRGYQAFVLPCSFVAEYHRLGAAKDVLRRKRYMLEGHMRGLVRRASLAHLSRNFEVLADAHLLTLDVCIYF
jgi:hypothetical protein